MTTAAAIAVAACATSGGRPGPPPAPGCRQAPESAVRWVLAGGDRQEELDRWCGAVGLPVTITPTSSPDSTRIPGLAARGKDAGLEDPGPHSGGTRGIRRLLVVSWNAGAGRGDLDAVIRDVRAGRWGPAEHWILLLQEAVRRDWTVPPTPPAGGRWGRPIDPGPIGPDDVVEIARRAGLHLLYVPSMRNAEGAADRGNAILSELPLEHPLAVELPFERDRRVAVSAEVVVDGLAFRVTSAHLDHLSGLPRLTRGFGTGRAAQMRALLHALPADGPGVLGGDLNTWVGEDTEEAVLLAREAYGTGQTPPPAPTVEAPGGLIGRQVDHLFARLPAGWRFSYSVAADTYGSDHHPIIGEAVGVSVPE